MTSFKSTLVLALIVLTFASCSQRSAESYPSVGAIGDALQAEEVDCSPTDASSSEAELVKEQGSCEIDGDKLEIFLFDDEKQRDGWLEFGGRLRPATATGPTGPSSVMRGL